jgi:hypothetical protein
VRTAALRVPEIASAVHPVAALIYGVPANYIWLPYLDATPLPPGPMTQPWFEWRVKERVRNVVKGLVPSWLATRLRAREIAEDPMASRAMARLPEANIQRYRDDLASLVAAVKKGGSTPILVTHVSAFGETPSAVDRDLLTSWRKFYPMLEEDGFLDMEQRANDAVRSLGRDLEVPVIDLAAVVPAGREYFADFAHLTDAGAALVGKALADGLEAQLPGLLAGRAGREEGAR